jgi:hypothetical protein
LKLTPEYRKLWATFDTPVHHLRKPFHVSNNLYKAYFKVGPLSYDVQIKKTTFINASAKTYSIVFNFVDVIVPEGKTLTQVMSEVFDESMTDKEATEKYNYMKSKPTGVLGVKTGFRVFSAVVKIVQEYFQGKEWDCLVFSSEPASRTDLYLSLIKRFFVGYKVEIDKLGASTAIFRVCTPGFTDPESEFEAEDY